MAIRNLRADQFSPYGGGLFLSLALPLGTARAQDKPYVMKISLPTLHEARCTKRRSTNWAAAIEKDFGGAASSRRSTRRANWAPSRDRLKVCNSAPSKLHCDRWNSVAGIDQRFEVLAAPGLVDFIEHGQRLAGDPAVMKLMLGLGSDKGLRGVGLVHCGDAIVGHCAPPDPSFRRFQGQEDPDLCLEIPKRGIPELTRRHSRRHDARRRAARHSARRHRRR